MSSDATRKTQPAAVSAPATIPAPVSWRQVTLLSVGALVLYFAFRALPTGTNLHSGDFNLRGKGMVELCDPANPQFVAVTTDRSPVSMSLRSEVADERCSDPIRVELLAGSRRDEPDAAAVRHEACIRRSALEAPQTRQQSLSEALGVESDPQAPGIRLRGYESGERDNG